MFREMRRFKQQVSQDECKKILKDEKRAAFSVIGDEGYPYTIPINFYYEEADHTIYFHGAREPGTRVSKKKGTGSGMPQVLLCLEKQNLSQIPRL